MLKKVILVGSMCLFMLIASVSTDDQVLHCSGRDKDLPLIVKTITMMSSCG